MLLENSISKIPQFIAICFCFAAFGNAVLNEGDACTIKQLPGICTNQDDCPKLRRAYDEHRIRNEEIPRCGFTLYKEVVCCPIGDLSENQEVINRSPSRPSIKYCQEIERNMQPMLTEHIFGGLPVDMGEYPHMAAVGYRRFGNDKQPYEFNCGGSLIASKFVLTAAHCVTDPRRQPEVVLLGSVSIVTTTDGVIVNITNSYPYPGYLPSSMYHDIAVIELESEVPYNGNIYPICLHANSNDLPSNAELFISGWGTTERYRSSNVLLGAKVNLVSLDICKREIATMGFWRKLGKGIQDTQICAKDLENDACSGDSGGPLMLVKDKDLGKYALVGIIVSGFNCGGSLPSFYTRVSAYLDFIDEIVWSNRK